MSGNGDAPEVPVEVFAVEVVALDMAVVRDMATARDVKLLVWYFRRLMQKIPDDLHPNSNAYWNAVTAAHSDTMMLAYKLGQRLERRFPRG